MNVAKSGFILDLKGQHQVFKFLVKDKHGAAYEGSVPATLDNVDTIRMGNPHFQELKLGSKLNINIIKFKQNGKVI